MWLPTGFRKSICYEVLLFIFDFKSGGKLRSMVLVISPLVSLIASVRYLLLVHLRFLMGTVSPALVASSLQAALVECREKLLHQWSPWDAWFLVHGTC